MAVLGAVLVNDTSGVSGFVAKPFQPVQHAPDVGHPVIAAPPMEATTVTQNTGPQTTAVQNPGTRATAPPATPTLSVRPTQSPKPPAKTPPPRQDPPPRTKWTLTLPFPDFPWYFPDCETAELFRAAPMRRGHPSYREDLDDDHDGVACER